MKQRKRCQFCLYWGVSQYDEREHQHGENDCRRHAPNAVTSGVVTFPARTWPKTRPDDWCGDFVFYED